MSGAQERRAGATTRVPKVHHSRGRGARHKMYSHFANTWVYIMKFYHKIPSRRTKKCMVLFSRENNLRRNFTGLVTAPAERVSQHQKTKKGVARARSILITGITCSRRHLPHALLCAHFLGLPCHPQPQQECHFEASQMHRVVIVSLPAVHLC